MGNRKILVIDAWASNEEKYQWEDVDYICLCQFHSRVQKHFMRIMMSLGVGHLLFEKELQIAGIDIARYKVIVCNEVGRWPNQFVSYIRKRNPHCHLIYCFWNSLLEENLTVSERKHLHAFLNKREDYKMVISSFDKGDCQTYGFHYNAQFIPGGVVRKETGEQDLNTDVFFVGKDKGRISQILKLHSLFGKLDIKCKFWVLPERSISYTTEEKHYLIFRGKQYWKYIIPYEKILVQDAKSRAILDIVQEGQKGLTWRPIEALHLHKKLITNFCDIKYYDFYNQENIFILGEDDIDKLPEFLNLPYQPVNETIVGAYSFQGMIQQIYKDMKWNKCELYE